MSERAVGASAAVAAAVSKVKCDGGGGTAKLGELEERLRAEGEERKRARE